MRNLEELNKLEYYLKSKNIYYERIDKENKPLDDEHQYIEQHEIIIYENGEGIWDVICQKGSFGAEEGLLEMHGSVIPSNPKVVVLGWLTANDAIKRIEKRSKNGFRSIRTDRNFRKDC